MAFPSLYACSREAIAARFADWGEPGWRLDQLLDWLYAKRAATWDGRDREGRPCSTGVYFATYVSRPLDGSAPQRRTAKIALAR